MKTQKHHIEGLIALLLFGVFAVCLMTVLLTGANAYRSLTDRDQTAYDRRVCAQYMATRLRQADSFIDGLSDAKQAGASYQEIINEANKAVEQMIYNGGAG